MGVGLVYWIEWREEGIKKRQRIGPSREAAELRLGEIRKDLVEERHIDRDKGARMSLIESDDCFHKFRNGKTKFERWSKYLDLKDESQKKMYDWAKRNHRGAINR